MDNILKNIADVLDSRKEASPDTSYVSSLLHAGEDRILKKVAEESAEVLLASKDGDQSHIIREIADLWFHTLVLLTYHGLRPEDVLMELKRREGVSGLDEKASRIKE